MDTRLIYVDDSGDVESGWIVYGWVEVLLHDWKPTLRSVLDLRKAINREFRIPALYELHMTKFANGRGNPSTDEAWNRKKHLRSSAVERVIEALATCPTLSVGSVHRKTDAKRHDFYREQQALYSELVALWDAQARVDDQLVVVFMDGNGSASGYSAAHRALRLASRHVIEDPLFIPAHKSQWVQMADVVAYSAFMDLLQAPSKEFSWDWYSRLANCDVNHGSLPL